MKNNEKTAFAALLLLLFCSLSQAAGEEKFQTRWSYSFPGGVAYATAGNIDGGLESEVLVALENNTLEVYDPAGGLKNEVFLGSREDYGAVRSIAVGDLDADGKNELVLGFGDRRVVVSHPWDEYFNFANVSVGRKDRFISRTVQNKGSIRVYRENFTLAWEAETPLSVQDLALFDLDGDGRLEVSAALGAHVQEDWWVKGPNFPGGKENWTLVEYPRLNGSVMVFNPAGGVVWSRSFVSSSGDDRVRSVAAGYLERRKKTAVLCGAEDGKLRVFSGDGVLLSNYTVGAGIGRVLVGRLQSRFDEDILFSDSNGFLHLIDSMNNTIWKTRFQDKIVSLQIMDLDADESNDIFAGGIDGSLYVLNSDGSRKWASAFENTPYTMNVADLNANELPDIVVGSLANVTVLEFRRDYFIRLRAEGFYGRAVKSFDDGEYAFAGVLLDKSESLYSEMGLVGVPKILELRRRIDAEFKTDLHLRATYLYQKSLEAYGLNKYEESFRLLSEAKIVYSDINDTEGISKVNSLEVRIREEMLKSSLIRADSMYSQASSFFGFRDYNASEQAARRALEMYSNISSADGIAKSNKILSDIAGARLESARRFYIGLDYERALSEAKESERLYIEFANESGVKKARDLMTEIGSAGVKKEPSFKDKVAGLLPLVVVALIFILLLSLYSRKKITSAEAEKIAESIEDEMGIIPGKDDESRGRPF